LNAQYAEESYQLKRENCTLKKHIDDDDDNNNHLPQTHEQNPLQSTNISDFLITKNQNELDVLHETIDRLSTENRRLHSTPNTEIAILQEELTLVKMRDAEAQVNMNELRQRIADLNREWQQHESTCMKNTPNSDAYDLIAHELISLKMREAQTDCDNKILSQKLMDIETQKQVLHNQIKRQDEEIQRVRLDLDESRVRENELRAQVNEMKNQMNDGALRVKRNMTYLIFRIVFFLFFE